MPEKFVLDLNLNDWGTLKEVAKEEGFDNTRDFIMDAVIKLSKSKDLTKVCSGIRDKKRNHYPIPEEVKEFYDNLSCLHSTNVSAVIFRYVILPQIISRQQIRQLPPSSQSLILPPFV